MAISVAVHLAIFLIADWFLSDDVQPSVVNMPLLVSLRTTEAGDALTAETSKAAPEADRESVVPEEGSRASVVPDVTPEIVDTAETVVDGEHVPYEPTLASLLEEAVAVPHDVVTTISLTEPVVFDMLSKTDRTVNAKAALSSKQEVMLKRKLSALASKLDRMPDAAEDVSWRYKGQEYLAEFTQLPAEDDMGMQRVIVEVSTEEDGKRLSTEVRMKRLAFSNYAQFVNRWDPNVQIHDDELDGRFHSNSQINLTFDRKVKPLFRGEVTTTARRVNFAETRGYARRDQIFAGGLETGVRYVGLPKRFLPFPGGAQVSEHQVNRFVEDTRITFYADGSYGWQVIGSESPGQRAAITDAAVYLIADEKVKLYVRGTVNGKVLVYSPERIVIEGSLVYEQHPEENPDADDYLGLVSDKYVDIAPPDVTGPGDLSVNAAIYAKRRFAVKRYRSRENALLYLYGSLSVGSLSATEPRYRTRIQFDRRLEELRPPGFPVTDQYEVESWNATWSVEPIG
ncbi:MAG: hypothetical protein ACE5FV_12515 [Woeseia sp.]